jgi:hypothetical protein
MHLTDDGRLHKHLCLERYVMTSELQLASTCIECVELWLLLEYVLGQFGFVCLYPQNQSEVDHQPETSASVTNVWNYLPRCGAYLKTRVPLYYVFFGYFPGV